MSQKINISEDSGKSRAIANETISDSESSALESLPPPPPFVQLAKKEESGEEVEAETESIQLATAEPPSIFGEDQGSSAGGDNPIDQDDKNVVFSPPQLFAESSNSSFTIQKKTEEAKGESTSDQESPTSLGFHKDTQATQQKPDSNNTQNFHVNQLKISGRDGPHFTRGPTYNGSSAAHNDQSQNSQAIGKTAQLKANDAAALDINKSYQGNSTTRGPPDSTNMTQDSVYGGQPAVQRKCDTCDTNTGSQKKPVNPRQYSLKSTNLPSGKPIQKKCDNVESCSCSRCTAMRKEADGQGVNVSQLEQGGEQTNNKPSSQSKNTNVLKSMGKVFNADFSGVGIHTNSKSAEDAGALAYTQGDNIHFAEGQYNPGTPNGNELLGHELTHVIQQRNLNIKATTSANGIPVNDNPDLELQADQMGQKAASQLQKSEDSIGENSLQDSESDRGPPIGSIDNSYISQQKNNPSVGQSAQDSDVQQQDSSSPVIQRLPALIEKGLDLVEDAGNAVVEGAKDAVAGVLEMGAEAFIAFIRKISPTLADILSNPVEYASALVENAIKSALDLLIPDLDILAKAEEFGGWASGFLGNAIGIGETTIANFCESFGDKLEGVLASVDEFQKNETVTAIRDTIFMINGKFNEVAGFFLKGAFSGLLKIHNAQINVLKFFIDSYLAARELVLGVGEAIWNRVMEMLGIPKNAEGESSIIDWLISLAQPVIDEIEAKIEPYRDTIHLINKIALRANPVGILGLIIEQVQPFYEAAMWIWENRNAEDIIKKAEKEQGNTMIPKLLKSGSKFLATLERATQTVKDAFDQFVSLIDGFISKLTGFDIVRPVLDMVIKVHQFIFLISMVIGQAILWVFKKLKDWFINSVAPILKLLIELLGSVVLIIMTGGAAIPQVLAGWVWRACPSCFKEHFILFIINYLIKAVESTPEVPMFGNFLWPIFRPAILGFLNGLKAKGNEDKLVAASNNIAKVISGASPEFIAGFVVGFLQGIVEGILDPFIIIYYIFKGLVKLHIWMAQMTNMLDDFRDELHAGKSADINKADAELDGQGVNPTSLEDAMTQPKAPTTLDPQKKIDLATIIAGKYDSIKSSIDIMVANFQPAVKAAYNQAGNTSIEDLGAMFGAMWPLLKNGIQGLGAFLGKQLVNILANNKSYYNMGWLVGFVTGTVVLEIVLEVLTDGLWTPVGLLGRSLSFFAKGLKKIDIVGHFMGFAFKSMLKAGKSLSDIWVALKKVIGLGDDVPLANKFFAALAKLFGDLVEMGGRLLEKLGLVKKMDDVPDINLGIPKNMDGSNGGSGSKNPSPEKPSEGSPGSGEKVETIDQPQQNPGNPDTTKPRSGEAAETIEQPHHKPGEGDGANPRSDKEPKQDDGRNPKEPGEPTPDTSKTTPSQEQLQKIIAGSEEEIMALLRKSSYRDVQLRLQDLGGKFEKAAKKIQAFRDAKVDEILKKFDTVIPPATQRLESDIDVSFVGPNAGKNLIEAEKLLKAFDPNWEKILRTNVYMNPKFIASTEEIMEQLIKHNPELATKILKEQNALMQELNFAKMLHHAGENADSLAKVKNLIKELDPSVNLDNIRKKADLLKKNGGGEAIRNENLIKIDSLNKELIGPPKPTKLREIEIRREIALRQVEVNFFMEEAYIGPGANRGVVPDGSGRVVGVKGTEAYQMSLSQIEMVEHVMKEFSGNAVLAGKSYEIYKYVTRFSKPLDGMGIKVSKELNSIIKKAQFNIKHRDKLDVFTEQEWKTFFGESIEILKKLQSSGNKNPLNWEDKTTRNIPNIRIPSSLLSMLKQLMNNASEEEQAAAQQKSANTSGNYILNSSSLAKSTFTEPIQAFSLNPADWISGIGNAYNSVKESHYNRNESNIAPEQEPIDDDNWRRLPENESIYHQNGEQGRENRKYVSTDGGNHEAVYDENGNLVTDDENMGTYNHYGPSNKGGHLLTDVIPYWLWGNNENDDTPLPNRILGPRIMERTGNLIQSGVDSVSDWFSGNDEAVQKKNQEEKNNTSSTTGSSDHHSIIPSGVKIHQESDQAIAVGALAYTQGNEIHFAPGQYNPETRAGQELLGHELAHVQQQKEGRVKATSEVNGMPLNDNKELEKEADDYGALFANAVGESSISSKKSNPAKSYSSSNTVQKFAVQRKCASCEDEISPNNFQSGEIGIQGEANAAKEDKKTEPNSTSEEVGNKKNTQLGNSSTPSTSESGNKQEDKPNNTASSTNDKVENNNLLDVGQKDIIKKVNGSDKDTAQNSASKDKKGQIDTKNTIDVSPSAPDPGLDSRPQIKPTETETEDKKENNSEREDATGLYSTPSVNGPPADSGKPKQGSGGQKKSQTKSTQTPGANNQNKNNNLNLQGVYSNVDLDLRNRNAEKDNISYSGLGIIDTLEKYINTPGKFKPISNGLKKNALPIISANRQNEETPKVHVDKNVHKVQIQECEKIINTLENIKSEISNGKGNKSPPNPKKQDVKINKTSNKLATKPKSINKGENSNISKESNTNNVKESNSDKLIITANKAPNQESNKVEPNEIKSSDDTGEGTAVHNSDDGKQKQDEANHSSQNKQSVITEDQNPLPSDEKKENNEATIQQKPSGQPIQRGILGDIKDAASDFVGGAADLLIPDWVQEALDALKNWVSGKKAELSSDGSSKAGSISDSADSQGNELLDSGNSKSSELQDQGNEKSSELEEQSTSKEAELEEAKTNKTSELEDAKNEKGSKLDADGEQKANELETGAATKAQQLEADGQAKSDELEAAQDAKVQELENAGDQKENELDQEAQGKEKELTDQANQKSDELTQDVESKTVEVGSAIEKTNSEAESKEQQASQEIETRGDAVENEANQEAEKVKTDWVALEAESDTLMGSLDARAGSLCESFNQSAQQFMENNLDPILDDMQEKWTQVKDWAKGQWDAFMNFAQPAIDAMKEKWSQFSSWVTNDVWPVIQEKASAFGSWAMDKATGAYNWLKDKWNWLSSMWGNAEDWIEGKTQAAHEWISGKATSAREWISGKAENAREWIENKRTTVNDWIQNKVDQATAWISGKADSARDWISGKADKARNWISGKADSAREWIGNKSLQINEWIEGKAQAANSWIQGKTQSANNWIQNKINSAQNWIDNKTTLLTDAFRNGASGMLDSVTSNARNAVNSVTDRGGPILKFFGGIVNSLISGVESVGNSAINTVSNALESGLNRMAGFANQALNIVSRASNAVTALLNRVSSTIINAVSRAAQGTVSTAARAGTAAVSFVEKRAISAINFVEDAAIGGINLVENTANSVIEGYGALAQSVVNFVADRATSVVTRVEQMATQVVNRMEMVGHTAVDVVSNVAMTALSAAQQWWEAQVAMFNSLKDAFWESLQWVGEKAMDLGGWILENVMKPVSDWVHEKIDQVKNYLQENFPGLTACFDAFVDLSGEIMDRIYQIPLLGDYIYMRVEILKGALLGAFIENPNGWNILGQVIMGFIPVAGQIADVRDLIITLDRIAQGKAGMLDLSLALVAFIPGLGDAIKQGKHLDMVDEMMDMIRKITKGIDDIPPSVIEATTKYGTEAAELIERYGPEAADLIMRHGDEGIEALGQYGDEAADFLSKTGRFADQVDEVDEAVDAISDAPKASDDAAESVGDTTNKTDESVTTTDDTIASGPFAGMPKPPEGYHYQRSSNGNVYIRRTRAEGLPQIRLNESGDGFYLVSNPKMTFASSQELERYVEGLTDFTHNGSPVVLIEHGSRPLPEEYLNDEYIQTHLNKFRDGVATLGWQNSLDNYGNVGRTDGLFVLSKSDMDDLIRRTGGDIALIEKELGIPEGLWQDRIAAGDSLIRVDHANPDDLNLRLPSGNEGGANDLWIPGGNTLGGQAEAIVDPITKELLENGGAFSTKISDLNASGLGDIEISNAVSAARNLPDEIKLNPDDLGIIADYMKRTGKSADDVAGEIPTDIKFTRIWLDDVAKVGTYSTSIKWGILDVDARPYGDIGYWGSRMEQKNPRVDAFELEMNPNNESFYIEHPSGGFVQFENLKADTLQDGKLVLQPNNSFYHVYDKPPFLRQKVLDEAIRQFEAAKAKDLKVEWLVSDQKAVDQLTQFFKENNVGIIVKFYAEQL